MCAAINHRITGNQAPEPLYPSHTVFLNPAPRATTKSLNKEGHPSLSALRNRNNAAPNRYVEMDEDKSMDMDMDMNGDVNIETFENPQANKLAENKLKRSHASLINEDTTIEASEKPEQPEKPKKPKADSELLKESRAIASPKKSSLQPVWRRA